MSLQAEHNCYLFHCGDSGACVFVKHDSYWTSHIGRASVQSDSKVSHEDDLENLGSLGKGDTKAEEIKTTSPPAASTTLLTTTAKPGKITLRTL